MPNQLTINGAQPQKPTRFTCLYNGRWSSGIWTNRSPLRDAVTQRWQEKFYGPAGDALIAGSNVEITNRLTLARRPGHVVFDSNSYTGVGRFDEFRMFGPSIERINVMIDEANALYSLYSGTRSLVWSKSTGAGQTYSQAVGNSLYFGNGVDNKKWLQSLTQWSAGAQWNTATTPFLSTFFIDPNGSIQQLTATVLTTTNVTTNAGPTTLTVTFNTSVTSVLTAGLQITFPSGMAATWLSRQTITILTVVGSTVTAAPPSGAPANYNAAESNKVATVVQGGTPISGSVQPTWSTTVPSSANNFQGGTTVDGTAQWTNRGTPVQNWGIVAPTKAPSVSIGSSRSAWQENTFYSLAGVIVDSNGNLQQVIQAGKSGTSAPTWAATVGSTTTDNGVQWQLIELAADLVWTANKAYTTAKPYIVANASGTNCLFEFQGSTCPVFKQISGQYVTINYYPHNSSFASQCELRNPVDGTNNPGSGPYPLQATANGNSVLFNPPQLTGTMDPGTQPMQLATINGAGNITGYTTPWSGAKTNYTMVVTFTLTFPAAGQYTFNINHDDGIIWGIGPSSGNQPTYISGPMNCPAPVATKTALNGYTVLGANNGVTPSGGYQDTYVVDIPAAGDYPVEIDYAQWKYQQSLCFYCQGQTPIPGTPTSGSTQPIWPAWSTAYASYNPTTGVVGYPNVSEINSTGMTGNNGKGPLSWNNLGPIADYAWAASINFTLPNTTIIDPAGNTEAPYRAGKTGTTEPTFKTGISQLTTDNPNLTWINEGTASSPAPGTLSTYNGGWEYGIALVNTLDDTVSNCSQLTPQTGNFIGAAGVSFSAGSGLNLAAIDPQSDYVAIFRTTDGQATPLLVPGTGNSTYTIPLSQYLANGYTDTTLDTGLNAEIEAAINGENTPPPAGAVALAYHLNRIFFSVGNTVYWTAGPDTPVGNGVNGVPPDNFDSLPSLVKRIVPLSSGALVFTVSDVYLISGAGTTVSPIQPAVPYLNGIGILSYNALDVNGSIVGMFTTDNQFLLFDPSAGTLTCGFPIGDQFRLNNGQLGQSWNPSNVYVTWHVNGEDQAWYVSDGQFGWYRLCTTPAPETGYTWSPFASIVNGCKAVQSIEVSPGVHKLLLGPTGTGSILNRDLSTFSDNGTAYNAYAVLGSVVLAQPGQVALVSFITTESVSVGFPLTLGVLMDEALPYYTGSFDVLKNYVNDPPGLKKSRSIRGQRFYLAEVTEDAAVCRHMQVQINFGNTSTVQDELLSLTVFGGYLQEL